MKQLVFSSPLGDMLACETDGALCGLYFLPQKHGRMPDPALQVRTELLMAVEAQMQAYFAGTLTVFDVPLQPVGTAFQQAVWKALLALPYGETISYQLLADRLDKPTATRAVANAVGRNPVSIIIPCHRIIGSNGKLTGYAGGVDKKAWMLNLEQGGQLF
ncbi:methylated-DNA--[protein]-cysteine S-methyltransferase [Leeia oryzae]|uniref:methylated-DNA--[protein]-cysteine S-methyltransferase n=1 Tax=Leeia oryzae TaxID=356662 RepID=UPI000374D2D5|nr:methylated-DNA--[protein]-cysteine S-methyltransferase [Leeia oryzae]